MSRAVIDAFHLPALSHVPTTTWPYGKGDDALELRVPRLTAALLRQQADALAAARDRHLADRPVGEIVAVVDRVAARLADAGDPLRRAAARALPLVTGYSPPMVARVLDTMAADWRTGPLRALLRAEFGDPRVLDEFRPRASAPGWERAFGPRLVTHVFSGNVPGVAVTSLVRALLVKAASLGKTAVGEPVLAPLFARAVAEEDAGLGECLAVTYWAGGDEEMERAAIAGAEAVVVYGGSEAVAAVRARTQGGTRFLGYGQRLSFAAVAREALGETEAVEVARRCALDVATFDQQGCVSPHVVYVEEGGETDARGFARLLADGMAAVEKELPRGTLAPREASAIRQLRGEAEIAMLSGGMTELHASPDGTAWTVVFDSDPAFRASCLNRVVRVKPVADLSHVPGLVGELGPVLQSVGVAGPPERVRALAEPLGALGASRVAPLGRMAWPPQQWHHDGHPPLRELVRWCDVEE
jgi:hypothetical protein